MSRTYHIVWASVAENDLREIIEYIAIDNQTNALRTLQKIKQRASSLYTLPERGRVVAELQDQGILIYRELVVPPWRIIYRISENEVYVLSVLDARRNVEDILLKRLADYKLCSIVLNDGAYEGLRTVFSGIKKEGLIQSADARGFDIGHFIVR